MLWSETVVLSHTHIDLTVTPSLSRWLPPTRKPSVLFNITYRSSPARLGPKCNTKQSYRPAVAPGLLHTHTHTNTHTVPRGLVSLISGPGAGVGGIYPVLDKTADRGLFFQRTNRLLLVPLFHLSFSAVLLSLLSPFSICSPPVLLLLFLSCSPPLFLFSSPHLLISSSPHLLISSPHLLISSSPRLLISTPSSCLSSSSIFCLSFCQAEGLFFQFCQHCPQLSAS